ncbi:MAG: DoxX family protein [Bacteroidales bacterium]|nr:DoxX family protein [Bacteroidales bacterium]
MKSKMLKIPDTLTEKMNMLRDIPLLGIRLLLAYAFYGPAMEKWNNMEATIAWFGNPDWGLGLPFPELNAYMAATTEMVGVVLLVFGIGTRLISIPMMFVMLMAWFTVHIDHGWLAIASSSADPGVADRLNMAKEILKENGNYSWLTEKGSFVILQNGVEFVATYIVMLLTLISFGPGKISVEGILRYATFGKK